MEFRSITRNPDARKGGLWHEIANTHKLLSPQKGHKDQPGRTIRKVAGEHAQKQADLDR